MLAKAAKTKKSTKSRLSFKKSNSLFSLRNLVFILVFGIIGVIFLLNTSAAPANATEKMGVHRGSEYPDKVAEYEQWLGRPVTYTVDFIGKSNPVDDPWRNIDNPASRCTAWEPTKFKLSLSTGMIPSSSQTLAAGARGDYNSHWKKFGETMVARGCGDIILRLGWEFNGKFYNWAAGGNEANFAAYWRQIVNTLRSVPGQSFKFDWCPLAGNTNANVEAAYPGDAYVDIIGLDAYDTSSVSVSEKEKRWDNQVNRTYGLKWQKDFAIAHGKQVSFPEWGLTVRPNDNLGGGDNPYYIQKMFDWMNALPSSGGGSLAYHSYFEVDAQDATHRLMVGQFPNATEVFRKTFGVLPAVTSSDTTRPTQPTGLSASATSQSQVSLAWQASTDNVGVAAYDIFRGSAKVGSSSTSSFNDSGLGADTTYSYYVVARDVAGNVSDPSNVVSAKTLTTTTATVTTTATTKFSGTLSKYGSKTFSISLPKAGSVTYVVTSPKPKGKFDVTVTNSNGSVVSSMDSKIVPIKGAFSISQSGTYTFKVKTDWWNTNSFTLSVTYPN